MAAGPVVTAQITANDQASAVLKHVADLARQVSRDLDRAPGSNALKNHFAAATVEAQKHLGVIHQIAGAMKTLAGAAGAYAAMKFPHMAAEAVRHYLPLEREAIGVQAASKFTDAEMEALRRQHTEAAQRYGESPEATMHAQAEFARRHMDAMTTMAMTDESIKLAKTLGVEARSAAKILEGEIFGFGEHVKNAADAHRLGAKFADLSAVMAKKGAMSAEDIEANFKYAAAGARSAGLSPEQAAALAMTLKREQFAGDEAGVFSRQLAARLMMPTNAGRAAMFAAGIDFDQFVDKSKPRNIRGLGLALSTDLGKEISDAAIENIQKKVTDRTIDTAGDFAKAVVAQFVAENGKQKAADMKKIAKEALTIWNAAQGQVDGERLWDAMRAKMTPQQMMMALGVKQGSKGASILSQPEVYNEYLDALRNSRGEAARVRDERTKGLAAAIDRLNATFEDVRNQFVRANQPMLEKGADFLAGLGVQAARLTDEQKQWLTLGSGAGAIAGGAYGLKQTFDFLRSIGGTGGAAAQLQNAATLLEAVAAKQAAAAGIQTTAGAVAAVAARATWAARLTSPAALAITAGAVTIAAASAYLRQSAAEEKARHRDDGRLPAYDEAHADEQARARELARIRALRPFSPREIDPTGQGFRNHLFGTQEIIGGIPKGAFISGLREAVREAYRSALGGIPSLNRDRPSWGVTPHDQWQPPREIAVHGDVTGEAKIESHVTVSPSPLLTAIVSDAKNATVQIHGALGGIAGAMHRLGMIRQGDGGLSPIGRAGGLPLMATPAGH